MERARYGALPKQRASFSFGASRARVSVPPSMLFAFVAPLPAFSPASTPASIKVPPSDPSLQYIGRFEERGDARLFDFAGCEIRTRLVLSAPATATVELAQRHLPSPCTDPVACGNTASSGFEVNAFVVFVNGTRQGLGEHNASFMTSKEQQDGVPYEFPLADLPAGTHDVRVVKATEPDWNGGDPVPNYMSFTGFHLHPASASSDFAAGRGTLPPLPVRKLEFLGDSITAGFCNTCTDPHPGPPPPDHLEAFLATWDYQVGELLDAQVHTAAWSGLGMVRNCCLGNTTMPGIFRRTLATENIDDSWDFASWKADALIVNLGTNDGDAVLDPHYDYVGVYANLVADVAQRYGIDRMHAFLACGPMTDEYCDPVFNVIANLTARGVKAHFLDQRGFLNGTFGPPCCGHPSVEVDTAMAKYTAATIKRVLGW